MSTPKRTWFPQPHQLMIGPTDGTPYLHSLWVGLTAPLFNLPVMLWHLVLLPIITGLTAIVKFFFVTAIAGVRGQAHGFDISAPVESLTVSSENEPKDKT
jgi:hypothetical protein